MDAKPGGSGSGGKQGSTCAHCGLNFPFEMPPEIVKAAKSRDLIIFAGAGVSTEVPSVFPYTMYRECCGQLGLNPDDAPDFPAVMQQFEDRFGRIELLTKIWNRLEYVDSFERIRRPATKFHRELATMLCINSIITTNWDTYFEEKCAAIPIVTGPDYALSDAERRKVYKIHGSIGVPSSIVATQTDYEKCLSALGSSALGGTLRHLLATKTTVFVGFSFTDSDFQDIFAALTKDLGPAQRKCYAVSPFPVSELVRTRVEPIVTDGTYFLHQLKHALIEDRVLAPDYIYDEVEALHARAIDARAEVSSLDYEALPALCYAYSYNDGMIDACGRMLRRRATGEYSDRHVLEHKLMTYTSYLKAAYERHRYFDAAYIEGYFNVLFAIREFEESFWDSTPLFFNFTQRDIIDVETLAARARSLRRRNRAAWDEAVRIRQSLGPEMFPEHTPFLFGVVD